MNRQQGGFALISAIFVVVVLAAMAAYMMQVSSGQQASGILSMQSARAYYAARAGIEWGIARVVDEQSCDADFELDRFDVVVSCAETPYQDGGERTIYRITAHAEQGQVGEPEYVSRELEVEVER